MSDIPQSIATLKSQAKALRKALAEGGHPITHSRSLELLAQQLGHRDWNTLHAAIGNGPPKPPFELGMRVKGRYLGQPFEGELIALRSLADDTRFGLTIQFDYPVDVVKFESMSNFRTRVHATVNRDGTTAEKTSDGAPHLSLNL